MDPITIVLRLLVPLTIFHSPLLGGLISMFLDGLDWKIQFFGTINLHTNYVVIDKILDFYYLSIEAFVLLRWRFSLAKRVGISLYVIRAIGFILFFITKSETFLFFFPNVFENYFIFYLAVWALIGKEPKLSTLTVWVSVVVLAIPKLIQEYIMHYKLIFDWRFINIPYLNFRYDNLYHQLIIGIVLILVVAYREGGDKLWHKHKK